MKLGNCFGSTVVWRLTFPACPLAFISSLRANSMAIDVTRGIDRANLPGIITGTPKPEFKVYHHHCCRIIYIDHFPSTYLPRICRIMLDYLAMFRLSFPFDLIVVVRRLELQSTWLRPNPARSSRLWGEKVMEHIQRLVVMACHLCPRMMDAKVLDNVKKQCQINRCISQEP